MFKHTSNLPFHGLVLLLLTLYLEEVDASACLKCKDEILYSVLGSVAVYSLVIFVILSIYCVKQKKKKKRNKGFRKSCTDIEGRRNKVYEDDIDNNEIKDEARRERKRQDSGFIASSNESIIPFPELYPGTPKKSPSMPNLSNRFSQNRTVDEDVFDSAVNLSEPLDLDNYRPSTRQPNIVVTTRQTSVEKVSVGTLTDFRFNDAQLQQQKTRKGDPNISSSDEKKPELVVIQKKSCNCTGLDFGIGGVFVKDVDENEVIIKEGSLGPGDEVLSINDFPINGLSDMEVFSFFAKSGPDVTLKIIKGNFLSKVENASVASGAFINSEISTSSDSQSETKVQHVPHHLCCDMHGDVRIPRVVADANNLSLDSTNENLGKQRCCYHHNSFVCACQYARRNSSWQHSNVPDSSHALVHHNKCDPNSEIRRVSLDDVRHSSSNASQDRHSRHSSNEHSRNSRNTSLDRTHSRNTSSENVRHSRNTSAEKSHNHHSSDDQDRSVHFTRTHSDDIAKNVNYPNGILYRSVSTEHVPPVFSVESYQRSSSGNLYDTEAQLYLHELLRQRSNAMSTDNEEHARNINSLIAEQYPEVTPALMADNVVLQRGYNNDYIVPVVGGVHSQVGLYTVQKQQARTRESSPSRRASPVSNPPQLPVRYSSSNCAPLNVSGANAVHTDTVASSSSSPGTGVPPFLQQPNGPRLNSVADIHRKPPPSYGVPTNESDAITSQLTKETVEIDEDVMRYMTKKYSEPRFMNGHRKDPPPYSSSHTTLSNKGAQNSLETVDGLSNVQLRRSSATAADVEVRSRPHSLTENALKPNAINIYVQEKRKHPQRTHSLPAVKHLELRPRAAQMFLNIDTNGSAEAIRIPDQQALTDEAKVTATAESNKRQNLRRMRQKQRLDSINRRKSIDAGTLKKLAEEIQVNPVLGGEYPIIAQLLGESQYSASERRLQALYRHKSSEALNSHQF